MDSQDDTDGNISFNWGNPREHCPPDDFKGFRDEFNFAVSLLMQITFGLSVILLSIYPNFFTSFLAVFSMLACSTWIKIHGKKMTRREVIFFEARNILEVDPPVFTFGMPVNTDDCLTPGDGEQREAPQPQTLWDALFCDEKTMRMDSFYRKHYGKVHETGQKMLREYEMQKAAAKEKESPPNKVVPQSSPSK
ncbi:unnamed protein product [Caenorhabditis sp. 36 PRJEB53466]|nr:unnamed protein product [Caenorhabditis sp. 36 PRJEB53466]